MSLTTSTCRSFFSFRTTDSVAPGTILPVPSSKLLPLPAVFGREAEIPVLHINHRYVSAQHIKVSFGDRGMGHALVFEQLGKNPTYVNGAMLRPGKTVTHTVAVPETLIASGSAEVLAVISFPKDVDGIESIVILHRNDTAAAVAASLESTGSGNGTGSSATQQQTSRNTVPERRGREQEDKTKEKSNNSNDEGEDPFLVQMGISPSKKHQPDSAAAMTSENNNNRSLLGGAVLSQFGSHTDANTTTTGGSAADSASGTAAGGAASSGIDPNNQPALGMKGSWSEVLQQRRRTGVPDSMRPPLSASNSGSGSSSFPIAPPNSNASANQLSRVPSSKKASSSNNNNQVLELGSLSDEDMTPPPRKVISVHSQVPGASLDDDEFPPEYDDAVFGGENKKRVAVNNNNSASPGRPAQWQWKCHQHLEDGNDAAWRNYDPKQNTLLEDAFRAREDRCNLDADYAVAFCDADVGMVQYRRDDTGRWRGVRRRGARDVDRSGIRRRHICYPENSDDERLTSREREKRRRRHEQGIYTESDDSDSDDSRSSGDSYDSDDSWLIDDDSSDPTSYPTSSDGDLSFLSSDSESSSSTARRRRKKRGGGGKKKRKGTKRKDKKKKEKKVKARKGGGGGKKQQQAQDIFTKRRASPEDYSDEDDIPFSVQRPGRASPNTKGGGGASPNKNNNNGRGTGGGFDPNDFGML